MKPYNHEAKTLLDACNISESDIKNFRKRIINLINTSDDLVSKSIEEIENTIPKDESLLRFLIFDYMLLMTTLFSTILSQNGLDNSIPKDIKLN